MYTRQSLADKIKKLSGIEFTALDQIFTSSYIAALYVKKFYPNAKKIYALGTSVLAEELSHAGLNFLSSEEHDGKYGISHHDAVHIHPDEEIDVVIQAYDDNINLYKLALASYAI